MKRLLIGTCAALLMASAAGAADTPAQPSPVAGWKLSSDDFYTILFANLSDSDLTSVYRICSYDGAAVRVSTSVVSGMPMTLTKGQCIDIATRGSVRLTRVDATNDAASGTYQLIYAARANHPDRSS